MTAYTCLHIENSGDQCWIKYLKDEGGPETKVVSCVSVNRNEAKIRASVNMDDFGERVYIDNIELTQNGRHSSRLKFTMGQNIYGRTAIQTIVSDGYKDITSNIIFPDHIRDIVTGEEHFTEQEHTSNYLIES